MSASPAPLRMLRPVAVMAYSGPRNRILTEYQRIQQERQIGNLNNQEFRYIVGELNKQQVKYDRSIAKRAEKREELRIAREEFERIMVREEKKRQRVEEERRATEAARRRVEAERVARETREKAMKEKREARKVRVVEKKWAETIVYDKTVTARTFNEKELYDVAKGLTDQAYLSVSRNGEIVFQGVIDLPEKAYDKYYDAIQAVLIRYDNNVFENGATVRIVLSRAHEVPPVRLSQKFRDGEKHCVLEPVYQLYKGYYDNSTTDASKKKYKMMVNRVLRLMEEYDEGVPEDKMEEVAKECKRCFVLYNVVGGEYMRYNSKVPHMFHFTNTRANHLEKGHITLDAMYKSVSQEELTRIMKEHDTSNTFYLFKGDLQKGIPQSIRSANGAWAVFNEDYTAYQEFNEKVGVKHYKLNATMYPIVNDFIMDGRLIHSAPVALCDAPNDIMDCEHVDMVKAYTQHHSAPYYDGFMGHVQQWSKLTGKDLDFVRGHLGMYRFRVVECCELMYKLGFRCDKEYTLPGPELLYLCDIMGIVVELVAGAWGSRFNFEYTEEMMTNRRYAKWAGKLSMENKNDAYIFRGDATWGSHLKAELGEDRVSFWGDFIIVKNAKKRVMTSHHITAFITSYERIHMLDMMRSVKGELVKVVLDGLYYRGSLGEVKCEIASKETKAHMGFGDGWYNEAYADISEWIEYSHVFDGSCVLAGAGGTGKTYSVFNDNSLCKPLYVVPSHLLGRKFKEEYGCEYTTIHKLIGEDCRPYGEEKSRPANVFLDENTMIDAEWVERALKMYPESRFYIAGDIDGSQWFQCRSGSGKEFSKVWIPNRTEWRYVDYTVDMRSKDSALRMFKEDVRSLMRQVFTDGGVEDAQKIATVIRSSGICKTFNEAVEMFQSGDKWIAGTHRTNKKLLERGVVSGFINARKEVNDSEGEMRGAFTCHSFQGLTIPTGRVFVSLDMFEYAMFYTAISRVCTFDQLVIIS